jgi:hypothetical protein
LGILTHEGLIGQVYQKIRVAVLLPHRGIKKIPVPVFLALYKGLVTYNIHVPGGNPGSVGLFNIRVGHIANYQPVLWVLCLITGNKTLKEVDRRIVRPGLELNLFPGGGGCTPPPPAELLPEREQADSSTIVNASRMVPLFKTAIIYFPL